MNSKAPEQQSEIKALISKGLEQGYLTYAEINDHLPDDIVDPEQIEDIVNMINDMGIPVYEKAPDAESLILADGPVATDDEAVEEAADCPKWCPSPMRTCSDGDFFRLICRKNVGGPVDECSRGPIPCLAPTKTGAKS